MKKDFNTASASSMIRVGDGEPPVTSIEVEYKGSWPLLTFVAAKTLPVGGDCSRSFTKNDLIDERNFLWEAFKVIRCDPEFSGLDARLRALLERVRASQTSAGQAQEAFDHDAQLTDEERADVALHVKRRDQLIALEDLKVSTVLNRLRLYRQGYERLQKVGNSWRHLLPIVPEGTGQKASLAKCLSEVDEECSWLQIHAEGDKARR